MSADDRYPYVPLSAPGLPLVHLARITGHGETDRHAPITWAVILCDTTRTERLYGIAHGRTAQDMQALLDDQYTCRACIAAYSRIPVPAVDGGLLDLLEDQP